MKLALSGPTLIVQPLPGIGDMVWHLPHIHAIVATTIAGKVDILTKPRSQADSLLRADPQVGQILWLERESGRHAGLGGVLRLATALRQGGYQRVWILHGSARYALAAWLAGIPERLGYGVGLQSLLLTVPVRLPPERRHAHPILRADALLDALEIVRAEPEPRLALDAEADRAVAARFATWPTPWIALGVGSSEAWKQWGAARFAELTLALNQRRAGSIFIVGGSAERPLAEDI
ncbi:MAG TPA: glycosyltransferase family 9 protein, partial [Candidatus Competibacter phosphatis]|nr:glycosyltransferase family 9 protein [Candidatus Competibacter phosphatis]